MSFQNLILSIPLCRCLQFFRNNYLLNLRENLSHTLTISYHNYLSLFSVSLSLKSHHRFDNVVQSPSITYNFLSGASKLNWSDCNWCLSSSNCVLNQQYLYNIQSIVGFQVGTETGKKISPHPHSTGSELWLEAHRLKQPGLVFWLNS